MNEAIEALLAQVSMFRRLDADDRRRIASVSVLHDYSRGDEDFGEGDPADAFYVVTSGRVKVVKSTPAGKEIILEMERSLYRGDKYRFSVRAT